MVSSITREKYDWTKKETQFLLNNYGELTMIQLSKQLCRSVDALRQKHYELVGFMDPVGDATLSTEQVADVLGVSGNTVNNWINELDFPAIQIYKRGSDPYRGTRRRYYVPYEKVWNWVRRNEERIDYAHIKLGIITPEPVWMVEKVKEAQGGYILKRPTSWTAKEDNYLFNGYFREQRTVEEIALELHRPLSGARRRLTTLRKQAEEKGAIFKQKWGKRLYLIETAPADTLSK